MLLYRFTHRVAMDCMQDNMCAMHFSYFHVDFDRCLIGLNMFYIDVHWFCIGFHMCLYDQYR